MNGPENETGVPPGTATVPAKRRRSFGLLQWLLLSLAAGVWLAVAVVRWSLDDLRAQVIAMRGEAGFLIVADPAEVHALRRRSLVPETSLWQVYVPEEPMFVLRLATAEIPQRHGDLPPAEKEISLPAGEHSILLKVDESSDDKSADIQVLIDDEVALSVETEPEWSNGGWSTSDDVSLDRQASKPPAQPFVLIHRRNMVKQPDGSSRTPDGPAKGVLLWIEAVEEEASNNPEEP